MHSVKSALARIGGVSNPDKMPSNGTSIPAIYCQIGAILAAREGTVCHECYALKGRYVMPNVVAAMERRYALVLDALADPAAMAEWIDAFQFLLNHRVDAQIANPNRHRANDARYFRWFDSGDLQSLRHLEMIAQIAYESPRVSHWLPTKQLNYVNAYLAAHGEFPSNLRVRVSAMRIGAPAPVVTGVGAGSTSHRVKGNPPIRAAECDAYLNDGKCGECRACWHSEDAISYPVH